MFIRIGYIAILGYHKKFKGDSLNNMKRKIWIDGEYVDWDNANVHILSHSHQRGSLIFGFIPIFENEDGTCIFRLDDHIERLFKSCNLAGIPLDYSSDDLKKSIIETVRINTGSKFIKISVYISSVEIDVVPQEPFTKVAIASYDPVKDIIERNSQPFHVSKELSVWIEKEKKQRRSDIISPQIKIAANYTTSMMAKWKARKEGFDEIFFFNNDGNLTEAPTSNVFIVNTDNELCTAPEEYILHGITRKSIIEIAKEDGIVVNLSDIKIQDVKDASEAFITSSSHLICPVTKIDNKKLGNGKIGNITSLLIEKFKKIIERKDNRFNHWFTKVE